MGGPQTVFSKNYIGMSFTHLRASLDGQMANHGNPTCDTLPPCCCRTTPWIETHTQRTVTMEIDADETVARAAEPRTTAEVEPAVAATISEEATSPTAADKQQRESPADDTDKARPSSPTPPTPPHCLGARGYDEGFCDAGSFFVYQHEPRQQQVVKDDGMDLELFGAAPAVTKQQAPPHLLQYKLIDGLRIKYAAAVGGENEVEGDGSEVAGRTFLLLQRQVGVITAM